MAILSKTLCPQGFRDQVVAWFREQWHIGEAAYGDGVVGPSIAHTNRQKALEQFIRGLEVSPKVAADSDGDPRWAALYECALAMGQPIFDTPFVPGSTVHKFAAQIGMTDAALVSFQDAFSELVLAAVRDAIEVQRERVAASQNAEDRAVKERDRCTGFEADLDATRNELEGALQANERLTAEVAQLKEQVRFLRDASGEKAAKPKPAKAKVAA